jgi:hypothetical protein
MQGNSRGSCQGVGIPPRGARLGCDDFLFFSFAHSNLCGSCAWLFMLDEQGNPKCVAMMAMILQALAQMQGVSSCCYQGDDDTFLPLFFFCDLR